MREFRGLPMFGKIEEPTDPKEMLTFLQNATEATKIMSTLMEEAGGGGTVFSLTPVIEAMNRNKPEALAELQEFVTAMKKADYLKKKLFSQDGDKQQTLPAQPVSAKMTSQ